MPDRHRPTRQEPRTLKPSVGATLGPALSKGIRLLLQVSARATRVQLSSFSSDLADVSSISPQWPSKRRAPSAQQWVDEVEEFQTPPKADAESSQKGA